MGWKESNSHLNKAALLDIQKKKKIENTYSAAIFTLCSVEIALLGITRVGFAPIHSQKAKPKSKILQNNRCKIHPGDISKTGKYNKEHNCWKVWYYYQQHDPLNGRALCITVLLQPIVNYLDWKSITANIHHLLDKIGCPFTNWIGFGQEDNQRIRVSAYQLWNILYHQSCCAASQQMCICTWN